MSSAGVASVLVKGPSARSTRKTSAISASALSPAGCFFRRQIVVFQPANAEKPLLQLAVGSECGRFHDAVNPAVDHDGDMIGNAGRHPDILFDDQDSHRSLFGELHHHGFDLLDNNGRQSFRRLVHDQEAGIAEQRA